VIYAGQDADNLTFSNLEQALAHPDSDLRLFGKPEGFKRRRMGVATARAASVEQAREQAQHTAGLVQVEQA
jgi:phosphoribosylglycinamide formyltransferase 2